MRTLLPFLAAVVLIDASLCNAFLNNFGRTSKSQQRRNTPSQQQPEQNTFGAVDLPLGGDDADFSGNVWSQQDNAIDPNMYTQYNQPPSQGSGGAYQMPYGNYQLPPAEESYADPSQGYHQSQSGGYNLAPSNQYELPPGSVDPGSVYPNYYPQPSPTTDPNGNQPAMSPVFSYQSFGQPHTGYADYSTMAAHQGDDGPSHTYDHPPAMWAAAASGYHTIPEISMPGHTQALNRLNLGGARSNFEEEEEDLEGISHGGSRTSRAKGKSTAESSSGSRVRQPQTARLASRRTTAAASTLREPSTARVSRSRGRVQQATVREPVQIPTDEEFEKRGITSQTHPQLVAAAACEIKITNVGIERQVAHRAKRIVEEWRNGPEYMYDFQGWTVFFRNKITTLRRALHMKLNPVPPTAEQMEAFLLANFRDLPVNFHGTLANPAEEPAEVRLATTVWRHFKRSRLQEVIAHEREVTMDKIAPYLVGFSSGTKSIFETQTLIKKYLRAVLSFEYTDIEYLEQLMLQEDYKHAREA